MADRTTSSDTSRQSNLVLNHCSKRHWGLHHLNNVPGEMNPICRPGKQMAQHEIVGEIISNGMQASDRSKPLQACGHGSSECKSHALQCPTHKHTWDEFGCDSYGL